MTFELLNKVNNFPSEKVSEMTFQVSYLKLIDHFS